MTSIPKYYHIGDRKPQILRTRLRLQCSSLNADMFKNRILDNYKCPCGQVETAEHFLLHCPLFTELRNDTIGKILMTYNIEILLKGCPLYVMTMSTVKYSWQYRTLYLKVEDLNRKPNLYNVTHI